jgi:tetratricopeptide (TPR) repeat protein
MRIAASLASAEGPSSAQPVVNRALAIARGVDDPTRAAALLTAIATSDGAGLVSQADRTGVLLDVCRAAESISSVEDRPRAFAALALAQVHCAVPYESSLEEAIELAGQVEYPKFHAEILEACATVLASAGKRERAARLLEEAVTIADNYSLRWDEYTWWRRADALRSLALTQARQRLHQAARDTVTAHLAHEQQWTLGLIAGIQIDAGELNEAAATIQLISEPDRYIPACGELACALARNKDPNASSKLDEFVAILTRPPVGQKVGEGLGYAALAAHYLGHVDRARELAERSLDTQRPRDPLERVEVFLGIGRAYATAGRKERATQYLEEAMRTAQSVDAGDEPTLRERSDKAIAAVALAQAAIGQYSRALAAIAQLENSMWPAWQEKPKAYIAIASLQAQAGQTTDADTTFSRAVAAALQQYDPFEDQRTGTVLESIVLAQARAGLQSAAWAAAEELREVQQEQGMFGLGYADRCLAKLADYYASASLHDDARKTAERIRGVHIRSEIEQSLSDGTKTGAAPAGQPDEPDGWESRARQMLDEWESKRIAYDPGSRAGQDSLELAETARVHGCQNLAIKLVAVAFVVLPCHKVLQAACSVEPSVGTLLEELEPW